mmetsp:Transcript_12867/g.34098  ORF Transcript_12867/g.34098 Transcript_12867/m.34098 type:complete len:105 (-) Transcript_12867:127-441(-)
MIEEFTATGAKTYGYLCPKDADEDNHCVVKCKGFTLNFGNTTDDAVTFENMKRLAQGDKTKITTNYNLRFKLTKDGIFTNQQRKDLILTANKRRIVDNYDTLQA